MNLADTKSIAMKNTEEINEMFSRIAEKYDLLNNLMTFGLHKIWKEAAIKLALKEIKTHKPEGPQYALDLCSGTGDLALALSKLSPNTNICCIDNCIPMIDLLKTKIKNKRISLILGDSENLNIEKKPFDLISIGFGLRNLSNRILSLENIYKHLEDGGIFVCIDLGHINNYVWKKMFNIYFYKIVPFLGKVLTKDKDAYLYLPTSLESWYKQEELKDLILKTGFKKCFYKNIAGGAVAIHIAVK